MVGSPKWSQKNEKNCAICNKNIPKPVPERHIVARSSASSPSAHPW